jgi:hypothetical protein
VNAVPIVVKSLCRVCGKFRDPREFVHDATIGYCWTCFEWHLHAMRMLCQGVIPPGCQECGVSSEALAAAAGGADVRMYLHPKDGIYQVLCKRCSDSYERKQNRLYKDTPYGHRKKLTGNH